MSTTQRTALLRANDGDFSVTCNGTKIQLGALSEGCRRCAEGTWSCLFINRRCQLRCFYCPDVQDRDLPPEADGVTFTSVADYVAYVGRMGVRGVGISGGEPLLALDRVVETITALRERYADRLYIWVYTNGALVDADALTRLRDAGVDELRFDISARNYKLEALRLAATVVPCVAVEIPAIPEDIERLIGLLPALVDAGVHHLNLHQISVAPRNREQLVARAYTVADQPNGGVPESELAALQVMAAATEQRLSLPINYCGLRYKKTFQPRAAATRAGKAVRLAWEQLTATGALRTLTTTGLEQTVASLPAADADGPLRWADPENSAIWRLRGELLPAVIERGLPVEVAYRALALGAPDDTTAAADVVLVGEQVAIATHQHGETLRYSLSADGARAFWRTYLRAEMDGAPLRDLMMDDASAIGDLATRIKDAQTLTKLRPLEELAAGLATYLDAVPAG